MKIPEPSFEQGESVLLDWKGLQLKTKIMQRAYNLETNRWEYGLQKIQGLYPASAIKRRQEDEPSPRYPRSLDEKDEEAAFNQESPILDWLEQPGGQEC